MVFSPDLINDAMAYEAFIQVMLMNPYRQSQHRFMRQAEALLAYQAAELPSRIKAPTSVLVGEDDQLTPPYLSKELAARISGATLGVLPGGHVGFVEYPERYNQALLEILGWVTMPPNLCST
jgi:3-oxoadipate enol-lactonase